jgi:hypothetical protein
MNEKEKIKLLISSYEKEINFCRRMLKDIEDDEKSRIIYETMLREKTMFLQVLKNI